MRSCHLERRAVCARSRKICGCLFLHPWTKIRGKMSAIPECSYFAYIMASRSHTLYIGVTGNPQRRVFEHKWKTHESFTERYNCDRLVWFEAYQYVSKAILREKQLKGWRREKKIALIEKMNPVWIDLSKDWYDVEPADLKRATDRMNT